MSNKLKVCSESKSFMQSISDICSGIGWNEAITLYLQEIHLS